MTIDTQSRQGRARGLYDEQLQRQQQEKSLFGGRAVPARLRDRAAAARPEPAEGEA